MESLKGIGRRRGFTLEAVLALPCMFVVLLAGLGAATALAAEPPPLLWGKEPLICPSGSGAGQCNLPRGVAADPNDGHVFVADQSNARINEFNALGQFIKAWGWDVVESGPDNTGTGFEICAPEKGDTCKAGLEGSGAGQLSAIAVGVAVDSAGNIYVTDRGFLGTPSLRVQKFSRDGQFQLMFGGEVNKTKTEEVGSTEAERNLCTAASGNECQAGTLGTGNGQFGEWGIGDFIAIDDKGTATIIADDKVYVGDQERIQAFDAEGHYKESLPLPGETVQSLATDAAGSLYAIYGGKADIRKLTPAGEELEAPRFEATAPTAVAVDIAGNVFVFDSSIHEFDSSGEEIASFGGGEFAASTGLATNLCAGSESPGNLYAANLSGSEAFLRAYGTDPIGCFKARTGSAEPIGKTTATLNGTVDPDGLAVSECFFEYGETTAYDHLAECDEPEAGEITGSDPVQVHADVAGLDEGTVYHFRLIARIGGEAETGADEEFKTFGPPTISDEHAASVAYTEAILKALVNPEGLATTYHFQYTTLAAFNEHGFEGAQSTAEIGIGEARGEHPVTASLKGLVPGTAYRWRVLAANESGSVESEEAGAFTTYRTAFAETNCPNQAFRTAASALLSDCRAYEMVSPVDKNGGDIVSRLSSPSDPGGYVQASGDGDRLAYGVAFTAFAGQPASFKFNQYLAGRGAEGWSTEGINPPVPGRPCCKGLFTLGLFREFIAFSPDLCSAWLLDLQAPAPTLDGQPGYPNLYRRQNCGAGGLEALVPSPAYELPPGTGKDYVNANSVQGLSEDSRHVLFVANAKLTEDAAAGTKAQLYDRFDGDDHLVSVLPSGVAAAAGAAVGSTHNLAGAVSADGSRVYWTSGPEAALGNGAIYLREHPEQGVVAGECGGPAAACSIPVSNTSNAFFWGAAGDGSKALYSEGGGLYEFDLGRYEGGGEASRLIASQVNGVAGTSADFRRIYFVSEEALAGAGPEAVEGEPNLYLEEKGAPSFVGKLVAGDVGATEPGTPSTAYNLASSEPYLRATRVSPDGGRIAFESRAPLTGFENRGEDGRAAVEVFVYEVGGALECVSCNPSGARPSGIRELREPYKPAFELGGVTKVPAAAWIPTWEHKLHASNVLSSDGNRLFFNSNDALLPRDANGAQDVYEWEAPGTGGCNTVGANYFPQNGGCLYLISSGESSHESEFWEADPDGSDIFFTTESSLLPQDPGSIDLYDARAGGGFPQPSAKAECEGETCQSPPAPPAFATPSSGSYDAPDGPTPRNHRCPKGKRKVRKGGKAHCVKKHKAKGKARRGTHKRRAAR